jgi:hypothetical protein
LFTEFAKPLLALFDEKSDMGPEKAAAWVMKSRTRQKTSALVPKVPAPEVVFCG